MTEPQTPEEHDIFNILKRFEARETNDQLRVMAESIGVIRSAVAVHTERDTAMLNRLSKLEEKFDHMAEKVDNLDTMASKWRGAFLTLMALGGAAGTVAAFWDRFSKWVHP